MKNKPRIAVIGLKGLPAFGGAASVGENIIGQLKDKYDFTVLSVSSHTSAGNTSVNGIRQVVFKKRGSGALNTFIYYWKSLFYVLFRRFDLIQLHHAESGFITPFLRLKYKVIVTFHGIYNYKDPKFTGMQNWLFRFSEKLNVKFANTVISVSNPDAAYIKEKYGRKIQYIPNGINISETALSIIEHKKPEDYILFAAGRIYDIKGLHLLLEAMKSAGNNTLIRIAGDLEQIPAYKSQIEAMSEGLNTEFLGMIKDKNMLMKLVANAKLFIFPSLTEAMSMMLLEVVSMKTPVIASDIPSNKEIFTSDEMLFFQSNDSADLREKLQFALNNPEQMCKKAELAFEKLSASYTWDVISEQYSNLYQKLVN